MQQVIQSRCTYEDTFYHSQWRNPTKCAECKKPFSQSGALNIHLRIHHPDQLRKGPPNFKKDAHFWATGEKLQRCDESNKSFTQFEDLKIHREKGQLEKSFTDVMKLLVGLCINDAMMIMCSIWGHIWEGSTKTKQLQPMWVCIQQCRQFEEKLKNAHCTSSGT